MMKNWCDGCNWRNWCNHSGIVLTLVGLFWLTAAGAAELTPLDKLPYVPGVDPSAMDPNVSPCEDFYQYACGGWIRQNPIPADHASWSVSDKLTQNNQRVLWGILETLAQPKTVRSTNQQKIGDYFAACMDEATIDRLGVQPIQATLAKINALANLRDLPALLARLDLDVPGTFLFEIGVSMDYSRGHHVIAQLSAGGMGLPQRDYYVGTDEYATRMRTQYVNHIVQMLKLAGDSSASAEVEAASAMQIETQLARSSLTSVDRLDPQQVYHRVDQRALDAMVPNFSWPAFWAGMGVQRPADYNVTEPAFVSEVGKVLSKVSLPELKAYLRWQVIHGAAPLLSRPFTQEDFNFFGRMLTGAPQISPRWQRCVAAVDSQLGDALGQEFVRRVASPKLKNDVTHLAVRIEEALRQEINELNWMSPQTKILALKKLQSVTHKIAYPDRWRDYQTVQISRTDYYGDTARTGVFELKRQFAQIGKPVDPNEWDITAPTVNAFYHLGRNDLNFPVGVLLPPLYDPNMDEVPNYGNTGDTIGHELTHGFDLQGRRFDAQGKLKNWWTEQDTKAFQQRAQCLANQYANYTAIDDLKINSTMTAAEDIADLGGLVLAWIAWKIEVADKPLSNIDGLTPAQRFFVGYGQWACSSTRPELARANVFSDIHSPDRYRVNGPVVNMPEFEKAFHCKKGQAMVPAQRCKIW